MDSCHAKAEPVDCSDSIKNRFVFEHLNATHHTCKELSDQKCSSSKNAFESLALCEKSCHHDDHH